MALQAARTTPQRCQRPRRSGSPPAAVLQLDKLAPMAGPKRPHRNVLQWHDVVRRACRGSAVLGPGSVCATPACCHACRHTRRGSRPAAPSACTSFPALALHASMMCRCRYTGCSASQSSTSLLCAAEHKGCSRVHTTPALPSPHSQLNVAHMGDRYMLQRFTH